ncbi:MAG: hypothetical protein ACI9CO_001383 [Candidatus Azotimanducaceae bacterium]|jgi:hypothetical protein
MTDSLLETQAFNQAWTMLQRELDLWAADGLKASFWWRDDDAISASSQLDQLDQLSQTFKVPVSIAVIPSRLDASLPKFLQSKDNFNVLQHGYSHTSYAAKGIKKIELGGERTLDSIAAELSIGYQILTDAFADQFVPVVVPPWNRIDPKTYEILDTVGLKGISTVRARKISHTASGLLQVNTHLDPISWRHGGGFIGSQISIALLYQHLYLRRTADRCRDEPTGLLTHHLNQNDVVWSFCKSLFKRLNEHPAVHWLSAREIWL